MTKEDDGRQSRLSQAEPKGLGPSGFDPGRDPPLSFSGFLAEMRDHFMRRADMDEDSALLTAFSSLEAWEQVFEERVELTEECAREIVDTELEHWDG
jgi:hypothetical protein